MSTPHDVTLRGLDDCGCCDEHGLERPIVVDNRPGLSAVAYRIGTHSQFKASMLARLSSADLGTLRSLTTRSGDDLSIALLDGWATIADVLTFYQERIANESYLRTATERRSLTALAMLTGYEPRPGVAASVHVAFTLEDTGLGGTVPIPAGTQVESVPGPGESPQAFETTHHLDGRPEWNAMRPLLVQRHPDLTPGTTSVTLRGSTTNLRKGDRLLLLCGPGVTDRVVRRVFDVTIDPAAGTTRVALDVRPPGPPPFRPPAVSPAVWQAAPLTMTTTAIAATVLAGRWRQADLDSFAAVQHWSVRNLGASLSVRARKVLAERPADTGVFVFRQRAAVFGHNAPNYATLPQSSVLAPSWERRTLALEPGGRTSRVDLDATYPGIVPGSWLALEEAGTTGRAIVDQVAGVTELTRADFTLSARVSRITLSTPVELDRFSLRTTAVHAQSEELELAGVPVTDVVDGSRLVLDQAYLGLAVGRPVVVSGVRADLDGVTGSEVATLADVSFSGGRTELVFTTGLAHPYERATVTVNANVAAASHGGTTSQALGSGDATTPFQRFPLAESPLTYLPAATTTGAESTLSVRVNDVMWTETDVLYGHGADDRVYVTRTGEDGRTSVQFGDGRTGARLPTGSENVRATYATGIGTDGMLEAGQLTRLAARPSGVRSVTNPGPTQGGADPDRTDDIRRDAPLPIRTLGRIVSLRDYEDFAAAFTGIAKALATWTWSGHERGVFLTVAGPRGAAISRDGATYRNLTAAIRNAGDPLVPVRVESFRLATFVAAAALAVDPAYRADLVLAAAEAALRGAFAFDRRHFGQPVAKSQVIASVQSVRGVVAVDLDELRRVDAALDPGGPMLADRLSADLPRAGTNVTAAAELLVLDPRPVHLTVMST